MLLKHLLFKRAFKWVVIFWYNGFWENKEIRGRSEAKTNNTFEGVHLKFTERQTGEETQT